MLVDIFYLLIQVIASVTQTSHVKRRWWISNLNKSDQHNYMRSLTQKLVTKINDQLRMSRSVMMQSSQEEIEVCFDVGSIPDMHCTNIFSMMDLGTISGRANCPGGA